MSVRDIFFDEVQKALIVLLYKNKKAMTMLGAVQNGKLFARTADDKTVLGEICVYKMKREDE